MYLNLKMPVPVCGPAAHWRLHALILVDRAVSEMRPSWKHIEWKQREEEEFVQEGMEIEQQGDSDAGSMVPQQSDEESGGVQEWDDSPDVILLDESDMGSVYRDLDHWSRRLEEVIRQDQLVEKSNEAGVQVTITRTVPAVTLLPLRPVAAPKPTPDKATARPTVASKVVIATLTQPSTSQAKTVSGQRNVRTVKKPRWSQDEAIDVDGDDQARARVSKETQHDPLKNWAIHVILARIPSRSMQQPEKASGRMRPSAYRYCVQFQDGVMADECEWWAYEHLKDSPNFETARLAFQTPWEVLYKANKHCPDLIAGVQILWLQDDSDPPNISVYYSILFGIPIVDWDMHESHKE